METRTFTVTGEQLIFKNFGGVATKFTKEGYRYFGVLLEEQMAKAMIEEGWNIKHTHATGGPSQPFLMVKVVFGFAPNEPLAGIVDEDVVSLDWITNASSGERVVEATAYKLDDVDIKSAELTIFPLVWEIKNKKGITAFLQTMTFTD